MLPLITYPRFQAFDTNDPAVPLNLGSVQFYQPGTTDAPVIFSSGNYDLGQSAGFPYLLGPTGEPGQDLFAISPLRAVLKDSLGATIWDEDNLVYGTVAPASIAQPNLLMNGGFEVWQEFTSYAGAAAQVNIADGWNIKVAVSTGAATDWTISRQPSGRPGSQYCVRIQRNAGSTSTGTVYLAQNCESLDYANAAGKPLFSSFWNRTGSNYSATSTSNGVSIWFGSGTDQSVLGTWTTVSAAGAGGALFTANTPWFNEVQPMFFGGAYNPTTDIAPVSATQMAAYILITGWNGTAGANDYIEIDDWQITASSPTSFERESYGRTLQRCQRRYYKTFPQSVAPAQNAGVAGAFIMPQPVAGAGALAYYCPQPRTMRDVAAAGATNTFNPSVANPFIRNITIGADDSGTGMNGIGGSSYLVTTLNAGSAAGNLNAVHYVIDKRF